MLGEAPFVSPAPWKPARMVLPSQLGYAFLAACAGFCTSGRNVQELRWGRPSNPFYPSALQRAGHLWPNCRLIPNRRPNFLTLAPPRSPGSQAHRFRCSLGHDPPSLNARADHASKVSPMSPNECYLCLRSIHPAGGRNGYMTRLRRPVQFLIC